jgi:hypothetical protein
MLHIGSLTSFDTENFSVPTPLDSQMNSEWVTAIAGALALLMFLLRKRSSSVPRNLLNGHQRAERREADWYRL